MTKSELIDSVAKSANISKRAAGEAVDATFVEYLQGDQEE